MVEYLKKAIEKPEEDISEVRDTVSEILARVKAEGEEAVRYYSEKFDGWSPESFRVSEEEIQKAKKSLPSSMVEDIDFCQSQVRNFAREQMNRLQDFSF